MFQSLRGFRSGGQGSITNFTSSFSSASGSLGHSTLDLPTEAPRRHGRGSSPAPKMPSSFGSEGTTASLRSNMVTGGGNILDLTDLESPGELLGKGCYGSVFQRREISTGHIRAVKEVKKRDDWNDERMRKEAEVLQQLDHPHVLRIFAWYADAQTVYMVMEYCAGGELVQAVSLAKASGELMPEAWPAIAMRQVFEAIAYCHAKGIIHKDLKSGNLLLLNDRQERCGLFKISPHVIVADLGLADQFRTSRVFPPLPSWSHQKVAGTPSTMSPEVWRGTCGPKADIWSLGCVMFELLTGRLPFKLPPSAKDRCDAEAWLEVHRAGPPWGSLHYSKEAKDLCRLLLTFKERTRPAARECLRHSWFMKAAELNDKEAQTELLRNVCDAVLRWRDKNPMQRALCLKLALDSPIVNRFASVFSLFDVDNSGTLSQAELIRALVDMKVAESTATRVARALDVNDDGSCEYLEFVAACLSSLDDQFEEMLKVEFTALDWQGRGELGARDMAPLLNKLQPLAADHGIELQDLDINGDGVICYSEFCNYFGASSVECWKPTLAMPPPIGSGQSGISGEDQNQGYDRQFSGTSGDDDKWGYSRRTSGTSTETVAEASQAASASTNHISRVDRAQKDKTKYTSQDRAPKDSPPKQVSTKESLDRKVAPRRKSAERGRQLQPRQGKTETSRTESVGETEDVEVNQCSEPLSMAAKCRQEIRSSVAAGERVNRQRAATYLPEAPEVLYIQGPAAMLEQVSPSYMSRSGSAKVLAPPASTATMLGPIVRDMAQGTLLGNTRSRVPNLVTL